MPGITGDHSVVPLDDAIREIYSHVSDTMTARLLQVLQQRWTDSLTTNHAPYVQSPQVWLQPQLH